MRTLVDIPDEDIQKLDAIAAQEKRSRASAIRDAVKLYLVKNAADRDDIGDAVEYQRAMREDRRPYDDI